MNRARRGGALTYWVSWHGMLLAAALASGAVAWWLIAWPVASLANVTDHPGHFWMTFVHMAGGTGMLILGGANLYLGGRKVAFPLHRRLGQAYLAIGSIGALSAFALTMTSAHKAAGTPILTNLSVSLAMLALAWLAFALLGWRAAMNRRFDAHRDLMVRAYVLVWAFVFCRLGSRVPALGEMGGGDAFPWLSWVGPLIACEIVLQWRDGAQKVRVARPPMKVAPTASN